MSYRDLRSKYLPRGIYVKTEKCEKQLFDVAKRFMLLWTKNVGKIFGDKLFGSSGHDHDPRTLGTRIKVE